MASRPDPKHTMVTAPLRLLLMMLAVASLALGVIGVFVPGLPTTVFVLIAAWAAARSSARFSAWLESHHLTGPLIRNWRDGGSMPRSAKYAATVSMFLSALVMCLLHLPIWIIVLADTSMALVLIWLWRRPEPLSAVKTD
ncbi:MULTISPECIES: YbaN family protein [unclassified Oceanobacter]|uniref:YbaN family protein n=1 Tax=unclassified Oceanobacter TaxID=2620260 RepID=UPI0026E1F728|nr:MULTISPECIES: YbaN family protein [unclassified Oceanobacter]MDO6682459.1 YbaN family protein [Oceanobacter sp. 5_MG-2023]MDP2548788.1 YbaN family protein [Oceanobacter sp. 4_MG-2023]MDP2609213.1 YbaN family protein [Oceanobacter sp. 1_MG-2023]MDP2612495.1 YbaN family protein [Oceanobacter sp. 2_MG-2023]